MIAETDWDVIQDVGMLAALLLISLPGSWRLCKLLFPGVSLGRKKDVPWLSRGITRLMTAAFIKLNITVGKHISKNTGNSIMTKQKSSIPTFHY